MNTEIIISDKKMLTDDIWLPLEGMGDLPNFSKESEKSLSHELFLNDDTPSDVLSEPVIEEDTRFGKFFNLESQPQPQQQQDRIMVCSHGSYPKLVIHTPSPKIPRLVVTSIHCIGSEYDRQLLISDWPFQAAEVEVKPKNPHLSLINLNSKERNANGFIFKFRIFSYGEDDTTFKLIDEFITTPFRIVSHSKMCMETRRGIKGIIKKRVVKPKEASYDDESGDSDESY